MNCAQVNMKHRCLTVRQHHNWSTISTDRIVCFRPEPVGFNTRKHRFYFDVIRDFRFEFKLMQVLHLHTFARIVIWASSLSYNIFC